MPCLLDRCQSLAMPRVSFLPSEWTARAGTLGGHQESPREVSDRLCLVSFHSRTSAWSALLFAFRSRTVDCAELPHKGNSEPEIARQSVINHGVFFKYRNNKNERLSNPKTILLGRDRHLKSWRIFLFNLETPLDIKVARYTRGAYVFLRSTILKTASVKINDRKKSSLK